MRHGLRAFWIGWGSLLIAAMVISPAASARSEKAPPAKICQAVRLTGPAPELNGTLDDPQWNAAEWHGDFTQREPEEGVPPTNPTEFKLLYDDEALYFAFRLHDDPNTLNSILARRDWFPGDWIEVNIDSYHDFRTAFSFTLSLSGTRGDEFISNDGNNWDTSWDPIWQGATAVDDHGWTAEMKIPLSQLRFSGEEEQVWGLQVHRRLFRKEERSTWQRIPKDASGWVSNFGEIHGLRGLKPKRRIEIMPYTVARGERFQAVAGDPYRDGSSSDLDLGVDGNIGLTSDLTLDFTVNPDFGQVEADPSQVNLSAFETFFSEKRPFFIEGADIFDLPIAPATTGGHFTRDRLFYSRRIGKRPGYSPDLGVDEFSRIPDNSAILGALKLSGKTAGGTSIGILESVTAKERADVTGPEGEREVTVEPAANYFVGRIMQDLRGGDTILGGMMTAVNRNIEDDHLNFMRGSAYAGGVDVRHYFRNRGYRFEARVFGSHVRGDREAIDALQTSSARYYQRPDNTHTTYDSTRTSLSGSAGSALLTRTGNNHNFMFQTGAAWRSPGFDVNDMGFMRQADEINQSTWMGYAKRNPFSIFNRWQLNANQWLNWDWGGNFLGAAVNANTNWEFRNRWGGHFGVTRSFEETSNTELRGGPSMKLPGAVDVNLNTWSDRNKDIRMELGGWVGASDDDFFDGWEVWGGMGLRPSNALQINVNPSFSRYREELQYVSTVGFEGADRYLFADLDQRTFALTFRVDYCLTPNLTLQYYGSPFVSAGNYSEFKRITNPQADELRDRYHVFTAEEIAFDAENGVFEVDEDRSGSVDYELGDPDFNIRDFNSNLVMRWEYRPGSTLFLVWSQARFGYVSEGRFRLGDDLDGLFREHPHNVFLVKFNQRFSL